jgi:hypothetical protein
MIWKSRIRHVKSIHSKCSGKCLRRVGGSLSGAAASVAGGTVACATLALSSSRPSALCSMPSSRSEEATQFREPELQVFDLSLLRAQIHALACDEFVMLNQQSLELGHVGRQSVDIEHAVIIPATGPACARDWLFLQHFSTHFSISSSSCPWPRFPSPRACRCDTIRINARERRAPRASPINPLEQHQQLRARQCDRARRGLRPYKSSTVARESGKDNQRLDRLRKLLARLPDI